MIIRVPQAFPLQKHMCVSQTDNLNGVLNGVAMPREKKIWAAYVDMTAHFVDV